MSKYMFDKIFGEFWNDQWDWPKSKTYYGSHMTSYEEDDEHFKVTLSLPKTSDHDNISVSLHENELVVIIPKQKPKSIKIDVKK